MILMVCVILLFALSMSFDQVVQTQRTLGWALQIFGLAFTVLLTEIVLAAMGIRFGLLYRAPYYMLLGVMFAAPVWVTSILELPGSYLRSWASLLFAPAAALGILGRGAGGASRRRICEPNGTPWCWPAFPMPVFVALAVGVGLRCYTLTVSFDPMEGSQSVFAPYFLAPLILAWSVLLAEVGIAWRKPALTNVALCLPMLALVLSLLLPHGDTAAGYFLGQFVRELGSPALLTALFGVAAYAYLWFRHQSQARLA